MFSSWLSSTSLTRPTQRLRGRGPRVTTPPPLTLTIAEARDRGSWRTFESHLCLHSSWIIHTLPYIGGCNIESNTPFTYELMIVIFDAVLSKLIWWTRWSWPFLEATWQNIFRNQNTNGIFIFILEYLESREEQICKYKWNICIAVEMHCWPLGTSII